MSFSEFVKTIYRCNLSARSFNVLCKLAEDYPHLAPYLCNADCVMMAAQNDKAEWIKARAQSFADSQG